MEAFEVVARYPVERLSGQQKLYMYIRSVSPPSSGYPKGGKY